MSDELLLHLFPFAGLRLLYLLPISLKKISEAFDKVDASLETSNKTEDTSLNALHGKLNALLKKDTPKRLQADSIYKLTNDAVIFIDSLKKELQIKDETGDRTDVTAALLVDTETAKQLLIQLTHVYNITRTARRVLIAISDTEGLADDIDAPINKSWDTAYFHETPTAAAVVMLTKFQNDCYTAGVNALQDIYKIG